MYYCAVIDQLTRFPTGLRQATPPGRSTSAIVAETFVSERLL